MTTPMRGVMNAVTGGAATPAEIARTTGLDRSEVEAILDHLSRRGRVRLETLGCGPSACTGCGLKGGSCSGK
ncbi:FeoC-like transcriptional regulator [Actinomadura harenae]|nr:FeoC-like transcriptional regulator [Actinomadura harenae]